MKTHKLNSRNTPHWLQRGVRLRLRIAAYLRLKLAESLLRLTILFLKVEQMLMKARHEKLKILFKLRIACLQFRNFALELFYCVLVFVHNLILYYRNNHDGSKPPNESKLSHGHGLGSQNEKDKQ